MKSKPADLWLRLLAHPLTLLAYATWLANRLIFQPLWPSFWTGKLGDFAGLFALPFLVGLSISLIFGPLRLSSRRILALALAIPGVLFLSVKIFPAWTEIVNHILTTRITPDFSDMAALPMLGCSALLWRSLERRPAVSGFSRWLAIPFALLVTLADMAAPDYGIQCLSVQGDAVHAASSTGQRFVSADGGLTWQTDSSMEAGICTYGEVNLPALLDDPARGLQYRFPDRSTVQISRDGGITWVDEAVNAGITDAEWEYIRITRSWNPMLEEGILNAVIDPASGNLVLAMGQQGLLIRSPEGVYTWADAGIYRRHSLARAGIPGFFTLLIMPLLASLLAGLLAMRTWAHKKGSTAWQTVLTVLCWLATLLAYILTIPALIYNTSFMTQINIVYFPLAFLFLAGMVILAASRMKGNHAWWTHLIPFALSISLISFLFYVGWYLDWIKEYSLAVLLSVLAVTILIILKAAKIKFPEE